MKTVFIGIIVLMLSGCMMTPKPGMRVWFLCYKDEAFLPNGMVEDTSILDLKCTGKKLQFQYNIGPDAHPEIFTKDKLDNKS